MKRDPERERFTSSQKRLCRSPVDGRDEMFIELANPY